MSVTVVIRNSLYGHIKFYDLNKCIIDRYYLVSRGHTAYTLLYTIQPGCSCGLVRLDANHVR